MARGLRMAIKVRFIGELRSCTGKDSVELAGGGRSLGAVVDELVRLYPRLGEALFDSQGRLRYPSLLVIDGHSASWPQDRQRLVEDGGELVITRFYSGG